ncbi:MAG: carboxypeptidase regulatory-like domain-containing protein [Verrucomicrobia bacterium]|nr:carboxypeptidase regulatory-like domain-containing protein [Verrucomicrobiota bacterium]
MHPGSNPQRATQSLSHEARGSVPRRRLAAVWLGFLQGAALLTATAQPIVQQTIPLTVGWNLISFQVGESLTPIQLASNLQTNGLLQIWGYDAVSKTWQFYKTNTPSTLSQLHPGRGYWVQVSRANSLTLSGPAWSGNVDLLPGWNLVGFPGLTFDPTEQLDLPSIFRAQLGSVPRVWRYDGGSSQRYVGYDSLTVPALNGLNAVEPGKGYWVFSLGNLSLAPTPAVALPADSDISPLQLDELFISPEPRYSGTNAGLYENQLVRFAGPEDSAADLNANGVLDGPFTQDTLLFPEGVNQQNLTIANTGGGLLNWAITSDTDWLTANPPVGVTGTEFDGVQILVNRAGLVPGTYLGHFTIYAASVTRQITVILRVPTVAGDYRGFASIQRVNGKSIALGKVDLNFSMFNDSGDGSDSRFRAVINRDTALLFPKDVFLYGVFFQDNDFSLTTSFESPTGDRNAPPYTTFQHGHGPNTAFKDVDLNGDGRLDNLNPFPFPIYRQVTLQGRRETPDRLTGNYIEAVEGILPAGQVIYLEGTFELDRETLEPTKKSIYNGKTTGSPIQIGGSAGGIISYTNTLTVPNAVAVQGVTATVKIDFPTPSELEILLRGPSGQTATLFRNGTALAPVETFSTALFNGTIGQGDWSLIVSWSGASGERGFFNGWELNLEGLEYFSAFGTVVIINHGVTNVVPGASVLLSGGNVLPQSDTAENGFFSFNGLTENSYSLNISKPGYHDRTVAFRITSGNVNLGQIALNPIEGLEPTLTAAPTIGFAPLTVNFTPLLPPATFDSLGTLMTALWDFGDGLTESVPGAAAPVGHSYGQPGVYTTTLTVTGTGGTLMLTNENILVLASGPNVGALPGATHFVWGGGFIGSIASPLATNIVFQESKRDMAAFDIDRYPQRPPESNFRPTQEDTDVNGDGIYQTYTPPTVGGVPTPDRFRLVCTLGGAVFGSEPARVGNFVLQAGRIED